MGTIQYDTIDYINVCPKADSSQLHLPHTTEQKE